MARHSISLCTAFLLALLLGACASTGVRVERASPGVSLGGAVAVEGADEASAQATRWALSTQGWQVRADAGAVLRVYTTLATEVRLHRHPFCDPWHWHPYHWGLSPYYSWGRYHRGCGPWAQQEGTIYSVRTLTWTVTDESGRLLWQASASETRPVGPPTALADRLAQALGQWQDGAPPR